MVVMLMVLMLRMLLMLMVVRYPVYPEPASMITMVQCLLRAASCTARPKSLARQARALLALGSSDDVMSCDMRSWSVL